MTTSLLKLVETARYFFSAQFFFTIEGLWNCYITRMHVLKELPEDVGEALCDLIDGESNSDGMPKRYNFSF